MELLELACCSLIVPAILRSVCKVCSIRSYTTGNQKLAARVDLLRSLVTSLLSKLSTRSNESPCILAVESEVIVKALDTGLVGCSDGYVGSSKIVIQMYFFNSTRFFARIFADQRGWLRS